MLKWGEKPVLAKRIVELWVGEFCPASRTVCSHLSNFGFFEYKKHTNEGTAFDINIDYFEQVIKTICPNMLILSSPSSPSSLLALEEEELVLTEETISEDIVNIGEDKEKVNFTVSSPKSAHFPIFKLKSEDSEDNDDKIECIDNGNISEQGTFKKDLIQLTKTNITYQKCNGCYSKECNFEDSHNKLYCSNCANDSTCFEIKEGK
ncbi:MAG: hypothetical protein KJ771_08285 [Nanoarchaeota archaeon]|nr:hypothetical protein [Nanoarchaeota archaeon]